MPTYTAIADSNGDFTVPFSSSYTAGQKVTVTAEKDGATKTIELNAPSDVVGGGAIQVSGSWNNFPANIGTVTMNFTGGIQDAAFWYIGYDYGFSAATGLVLGEGCTFIGSYAFNKWRRITSLVLPNSLQSIYDLAFENCSALTTLVIPDGVTNVSAGAFRYCTGVTSLTLGTNLTTIGGAAFSTFANCNEIICKNPTPPAIASNTFESLKSTCVFKVPTASLSAYQSAANWSLFASQMIGI